MWEFLVKTAKWCWKWMKVVFKILIAWYIFLIFLNFPLATSLVGIFLLWLWLRRRIREWGGDAECDASNQSDPSDACDAGGQNA